MYEAMLYDKLPNNRVKCNLCAHHCLISEGKKGICHVRQNREGVLYSRVYGLTISQNIDPIEKKPLFHFQPGSKSYSIATPGCNFKCQWCQNADISQWPKEQEAMIGKYASPEQIVDGALKAGCRSISYTYTEPTVFFEYTFDTSKLAHEAGLANIYVSNGYMSTSMLDVFHPYLDAINVDLKAFREETYQEYTGAKLQPILDNLKLIRKLGILLEVTTLIIPGINDDPEELRDAARFIASELGVDTPWHLSRFHPMYQMRDIASTPIETLQLGRRIGREEGLHFVYIGNVPGGEGESTVCYSCENVVVQRIGYYTRITSLNGSKCGFCGADLNITC